MAEFETTLSDIFSEQGLNKTQEQGFAVIRGFFSHDDLAPLRDDFDSLAAAFGQPLGLTGNAPKNEKDRDVVAILNEAPALQPTLYDRLQMMPSLLATPNHPKVRKLAQHLLQSDRIGTWPRVQMRLDLRDDSKNVILWHHDYLYNQGTQASYTFWLAFNDIDETMGLLQIAPGSHHVRDIEFVKRNDGSRFDFTLTEEQLKQFDLVRPDSYRAGDLVVFHSLVIHSGAMNKNSARARMPILFRMQDLNKLEAFQNKS